MSQLKRKGMGRIQKQMYFDLKPEKEKVMILETAVLSIKNEAKQAFEDIFPKAAKHLASAKGYIGHEIRRSVDVAGNYILLIKWQTKEDHTEGFCKSDLFTQFVELLSPHFKGAPAVEHYEVI
jgi:heme-degrading monooxygenase HmoA